ncbi:MAG: hypothetical protein MJ097_02225 [Dorea sp.]|nr:hypothetical protein [Dorea sp.]
MDKTQNAFDQLTGVLKELAQKFKKNPDLLSEIVDGLLKENNGTINQYKKDTLSEMTSGMDKYIDQKRERIAEATRQLTECVRKGNAKVDEWKKAVSEKDTEKAKRLAAELEKASMEVKELKKKVMEAKNSPVFPDGAVEEEWAKLCEKIRGEWTEAFHTVEYALKQYQRAATTLITINDIMRQARAVMLIKARQNGADPKLGHILTDGINREKADALLLADDSIQTRIKAVYSGPEHTLI